MVAVKDRGNRAREKDHAGREAEQHVTPPRQRQRERMNVATAMIRSPRGDRHQQAERAGEQRVERPPGLHGAKQLLRL